LFGASKATTGAAFENLLANSAQQDTLSIVAKNKDEPGNLFVLALVAVIAGALAGFVASLFRLALEHADRWRDALIVWAHGSPILGFVLVVATVAATTGIGAWLVRRFAPHAGGSGIPHVEAVVKGELPPAPFRLFPVKFIGGWLAIGGGLALGREGPSVQMGATLAEILGRLFRRSVTDCRTLLAACAGAGLATAFNAPMAGAVFVLEELVRRFDTRIAIAALGASAGAIGVARLFIGNAPDFQVAPIAYPGFGVTGIYLVLGVIAGVVGMAYNRAVVGALAANDRLGRLPVELRAAMIGTAVGMLAWFAPRLVGGGDALTQGALSGTEALGLLGLAFVLRFGLGAVSYAARTPGGLFAPMLVLGAQLGVLFGAACRFASLDFGVPPAAFAIVGMAAFFSAVVRAPVTGIVLITEMTASFTQLLPMLCACFTAMAVPTFFGNPPIYDSLREQTLRRAK
jgi:chloride channel protein, CIC family